MRAKLLRQERPNNFDYNPSRLLEPRCAVKYHCKIFTAGQSATSLKLCNGDIVKNNRDTNPIVIHQSSSAIMKPDNRNIVKDNSDTTASVVHQPLPDLSNKRPISKEKRVPQPAAASICSDQLPPTMSAVSSSTKCSSSVTISSATQLTPKAKIVSRSVNQQGSICPHCGESYAHRSSLSKHIKKAHNDAVGEKFSICCNMCSNRYNILV